MDQFVCVRIVQANAMDLSLFQFDYDLTLAAFFMNADKTIYGRFGTRSDTKDATRDISIEGLRRALQAALKWHKGLSHKQEFVPRQTACGVRVQDAGRVSVTPRQIQSNTQLR